MATANFIDQQTYEFKPYDRQDFNKIEPYLPSGHFESLAKMTLDIAGGLHVIIEMLEQNNLDKDLEDKTLLSPYAEGQLFRMAARVSGMLTEEVCGAISLVESRHAIKPN